MVTSQNPKPAPTFFSNPEEGPAVVDTNSPMITVLIKGKEIPGKIVDGGSEVNVINQRTYDTLSISENGKHAHSGCEWWMQVWFGQLDSSGTWRLQSVGMHSGYPQ